MCSETCQQFALLSYLLNYTALKEYLKFFQSRKVSTSVVITIQANSSFFKLNYMYSYLHV